MEFADTVDTVLEPQAPDAPTRERVVRSILAEGPSTAAALAQRLNLTPAAVRRHLDQLIADGAVEARDARHHTQRGRGRPARTFALTDAGRDRLDSQYDDLAVAALRFLRRTGGESAVRSFAEERVSFIERQFPQVAAQHPEWTPAQVLAEVLSAEGYAASVRRASVGEQVCQQHCPVSHVAHEFPELCHAETQAFAAVLGSHVQRLATIARGDGVCTTCVPAQRAPHDRSSNVH